MQIVNTGMTLNQEMIMQVEDVLESHYKPNQERCGAKDMYKI